MGVFTVASLNQTPAVVGNYNIYLANREDKVFTSQMFTTLTTPVYSNYDSSIPTHVKILSLPGTPGVLLYNGIAVSINQEISIADIDIGLLTYDAPDQDTLVINSFTFTIKTASLAYAVDTGTFSITSGKVVVIPNSRPTIGLLTLNIANAGTHSFTLANFTTETVPPYYDPEGDAALELRIDTYPVHGDLTLSGLAVSVGQIIPVANIPNLLYTAKASREDDHLDAFNYNIKDTGSGQFSLAEAVNINVAAKVFTAPVITNITANISTGQRSFSLTDFTSTFSDTDGNSYKKVKLIKFPIMGSFSYLGSPVIEGDEVLLSNISGLVYTLPMSYTIENGSIYKYSKDVSQLVTDYQANGYNLISHQNGIMTFEDSNANQVTSKGTLSILSMQFMVSDDSSKELYSNTATLTLNGSGNVHVQPAYVNSDPVVSDSSLKVLRSTIPVLNRELFLKDYYDVEGNTPYSIEILVLPTNGVVALNGVPVSVGQFVLFTDIDNELLTFDPDDNTAVINVSLEFKVHDNG